MSLLEPTDLPQPTDLPVDPPSAPLDVPYLQLVNLLRSGDGFVVQAVGAFPGAGCSGAMTRVDISVCAPVDRRAGREAARQAERELAAVARRLQDWCDSGTPLRLVAATGSPLTLVAEDGTELPLPRSA
jgi:hypothetical protein